MALCFGILGRTLFIFSMGCSHVEAPLPAQIARAMTTLKQMADRAASRFGLRPSRIAAQSITYTTPRDSTNGAPRIGASFVADEDYSAGIHIAACHVRPVRVNTLVIPDSQPDFLPDTGKAP